jgi:hypothetical protein
MGHQVKKDNKPEYLSENDINHFLRRDKNNI